MGRSHARAMLVEAAWAAGKARWPWLGAPCAHLLTKDEDYMDAPGAGRQQDPRDATSSRTSATER
ncbi:hypothetical protein [Bradyrhizobium sp. USDA 328]|uniref:hypothetical protein n=1 Tax=unclassified Bradyrhizobium TaxID=2631580 RepID=UPI00351162E5